ncbi:putative Ig domain-containing protein, partial [Nibrella saemangeumensis]|uniref:putative Ig domain-containing protein n=1 Tax=Nibrella saemangeumensis TaxID=1084526 RepID=UPI0031EDCFA7
NAIPNQSGTAGTAFSYTVPTNTFSDPDGDVLAYQITGLPAGLTANGLSISGTPTTAGTATITVRATDPAGLSVSATFSLSVAAAPVANRAPVVQNAIPNQSGTAGTAFSYTVPTNTFSDPDGDVLAYQITGLPAGLSANGLSISGTPTTAGTATVTVKATDPAGLNVSTAFSLAIAAAPVANRAPVVQNAIPNQSGTAGTAFSYTVPTNTFSDPDGDVLAYQITGLPAGLSANGLSISGTPTTVGTATITVRATDPAGLNVSATFSLAIAAAPVANRAPVVANPIPNQNGRLSTVFNYTVPTSTFSDPDGDVLTYRISGLPAGLSSKGLTISGTPKKTGTSTISVRATDPDGLAVTATFNLIVSNSSTRIGVASEETGDWIIYPNPAEDYVTISLPEGTDQSRLSVAFIATIGARIPAESVEEVPGGLRVPVQRLTPGLYILTVSSDQGVLMAKKFLKK